MQHPPVQIRGIRALRQPGATRDITGSTRSRTPLAAITKLQSEASVPKWAARTRRPVLSVSEVTDEALSKHVSLHVVGRDVVYQPVVLKNSDLTIKLCVIFVEVGQFIAAGPV